MKALNLTPQGIFTSSRVNTYLFIVGISLIIQSIKDWLNSELSKTIIINILSLVLFPISILLFVSGFFLGRKLKKTFKEILIFDAENVTEEDYKVIQHTIKAVGPNADIISSLSKKRPNFKLFPIIFWGFLNQFNTAIKLFCKHYENCKKVVDKLDSVAPKDPVLEHVSTDKLWERRTKSYEYLI